MGGAILLGLLNGLNIAVIGMGIVLIFKTGKYINLAQAQLGIVPMLLLGKVCIDAHWNWYLGFVFALVVGALLGIIFETLIVRPLSKLGPQAVLVGTLGVSQVLIGLAYVKQLSAKQRDLIANGYPVPFNTRFKIAGATFFSQHLLTIIVVPTVALLLWIFLSRTLTGKSIRATACNTQAAQLAGLSIRRLSLVAWSMAGIMAAIGAILAAPNSPAFDPASVGPGLMFAALGAAALAGFSSFIQVVGAAALLSVIQAIVVYKTSDTAKGILALFIVTLVGMILRRNSAAMRETAGSLRGGLIRPGMSPAQRASRPGRIGAVTFPTVMTALAFILIIAFRHNPVNLFRLQQIVIMIAIAGTASLLAGLTGQMSLGHAAFIGLGAGVVARIDRGGSHSMLLNLLVAGVITAVVYGLVGLTSLRGGALMPLVATLGFGVLCASWLFNQKWFNKAGAGYEGGSSVKSQSLPFLGGLKTGPSIAVAVTVLIFIVLMLGAWLQRSPLGKRMAAVRFSDDGARSIGLNVELWKLLAVSLVGLLSGFIGALDVSVRGMFAPTMYNPQVGLVVISLVVIGGMGSMSGAGMATIFVYGLPLFLAKWIQSWGGNPLQIQLFLGGAGLVINLLLNPGGLATVFAETFHKLTARRGKPDEAETATLAPASAQAVSARQPDMASIVLRTDQVTKNFGVVRALDEVTIKVGTNEIVGLIGNNGAGKTTLLSCIAGTLSHEGDVEIFSTNMKGRSIAQRSRTGIGRTFQDARLFAGLTVREVFALAAGQRVDSAAEGTLDQSNRERAEEVLDTLGLAKYAFTLTADLPTGVRRMVELGIQLSRRPRIILLDEPAAGLSQAEVHLFGPRLREIVDRLGCSVLMIEHDIPLMLSLADRIYCLELGRIIAEGTPDEIRQNPAVVESYFGTPGGVGARRSGDLATDAVLPDPQPIKN